MLLSNNGTQKTKIAALDKKDRMAILETARLRLRAFRTGDAADLFADLKIADFEVA